MLRRCVLCNAAQLYGILYKIGLTLSLHKAGGMGYDSCIVAQGEICSNLVQCMLTRRGVKFAPVRKD